MTEIEAVVAVGPSIELHGTLLLPGDGRWLGAVAPPLPAMLILGGTGGDTRDGEPRPAEGTPPPRRALMRHLAEALAAVGVASLRMDKRGVGASGGDASASDYDTDLVDNLAAFGWLRSHDAVDATRVGVAGHSAGAFNACLVAKERGDAVACVGLLGALHEPIDDLVRRNWPRIATLWPLLSEERRAWLLEHRPREVVAAFGAERFIEAARRGDDVVELDALGLQFAYSIVRFRQDLERPVADAFDHVTMPALVLHGAGDLNVDVADALDTFRRLRAVGNRDVTLCVLPGLDHSFQVVPADPAEQLWERVSMGSYANLVSPDALDAWAGWASRVLGTART